MIKIIYFYLSKPDLKLKIEGRISKEQFEQVENMFPEFWHPVPNPCIAHMIAPLEGERTKQLLECMETLGLRPCWQRIPHVNKMPREERWIEIKGKIEFELEDFERSDFLEVRMPEFPEMGEGTRNSDGSPSIERFDPSVELGHIISVGTLYAQARIKEKLSAGGWQGLTMPEMQQISGLPVPLWQMQSDREMPPSANQWYQDPFFRGKEPNFGLYDKSIFEPWPAQYRAVDLKTMDGIDFAYTYEWLTNGPPLGHRKLLCSKRFYNWSKAEKLSFEFVPVLVVD